LDKIPHSFLKKTLRRPRIKRTFQNLKKDIYKDDLKSYFMKLRARQGFMLLILPFKIILRILATITR
jgi:hypothetical protein